MSVRDRRLGASIMIPVVTAVVLATGLVAGVGTRAESQPAAVSAEPGREIGVSAGSDLLWADKPFTDRLLTATRDLGARHVRIDIAWPAVEPQRGQFDWSRIDRMVISAQERGLGIIGIIGYTPAWATASGSGPINEQPARAEDYAEFAERVAARYATRIATFEVWNEPNADQFFAPRSPAAYAHLVEAAYPRIKGAAPNSTVLAGALAWVADSPVSTDPATFLSGMYDAGAGGHFDALSVHPYSFPRMFTDDAARPNTAGRFLADTRRVMVERGDGGKRVWATEFGAPTSVVSEQQQAQMLVGMARSWAAMPWAGPVSIYSGVDRNSLSWNREDRFGIARSDFVPKQAYYGVRDVIGAGVPVADLDAAMAAGVLPQHGAPVAPAYRMATCTVREHESVSLFRTSRGFFTTPVPESAAIRRVLACPIGPFENGMQDLESAYGLRLYSSAAAGIHLVQGAILAAWRPELGFPTSDEYTNVNGQQQSDFERGYITWTLFGGANVTVV